MDHEVDLARTEAVLLWMTHILNAMRQEAETCMVAVSAQCVSAHAAKVALNNALRSLSVDVVRSMPTPATRQLNVSWKTCTQ